MNNEKICPLTQRTCYRAECGMWLHDRCAVVSLAQAAALATTDVYLIRKELENK